MKIFYYLFIIISTTTLVFSQTNQADVVPGGGGVSQNVSYTNYGTFGQTLASESSNSSYTNKEGFLNAQAATLPILTTTTASSISSTSAISGGNITFNGNSPITYSGVIISVNSNIELGDIGVTAFYTSPLVTSGLFTKTLSGLSPGTTYYYRAFAINEAGIGYGSEYSFTTIQNIQARRIVFTDVQQYQLSLKFTIGNGDARLVMCKESYSISATPLTNGVTYTANNWFKRGSSVDNAYVVFKGTNNAVTVKGLSKGKLYFFRVFEYFGSAGSEIYNQTTADYNPVGKLTLKKDGNISDFYDTQTLSVFPNPSCDILNLKLNFEESKTIDVTVYDINGNVVLHPFYSYQVGEGTTQLTMNVKDLPTGTYQVLVNTDSEVVYESFSVIK